MRRLGGGLSLLYRNTQVLLLRPPAVFFSLIFFFLFSSSVSSFCFFFVSSLFLLFLISLSRVVYRARARQRRRLFASFGVRLPSRAEHDAWPIGTIDSVLRRHGPHECARAIVGPPKDTSQPIAKTGARIVYGNGANLVLDRARPLASSGAFFNYFSEQAPLSRSYVFVCSRITHPHTPELWRLSFFLTPPPGLGRKRRPPQLRV